MDSRSQMWSQVLQAENATSPLLQQQQQQQQPIAPVSFPELPPLPTHQQQCQIKQKQKQDIINNTSIKDRWNAAIQSKFIVSVMVGVFVVVLLLAVNPPLAQCSDGSRKRSPGKIIAWASVFTLLSLVLPYGASIFSKKV